MERKTWNTRTDAATATARAFGRNRHNAKRRRKMWQRRFFLLALVNDWESIPRGFQTLMAQRFKVSRCVISKDMVWVLANQAPGFKVKCQQRGRAISLTYTNELPIWMRRKREFERLAKQLFPNFQRS
jgi:hypothetical protein